MANDDHILICNFKSLMPSSSLYNVVQKSGHPYCFLGVRFFGTPCMCMRIVGGGDADNDDVDNVSDRVQWSVDSD